MSTSHTSSAVLKQDQLGRFQNATHRIEKLVWGQQSALSATAFAQLVGVRYHTLCKWLKERGLTGKWDQRDQRRDTRGLGGSAESQAPSKVSEQRSYCCRVEHSGVESHGPVRVRLAGS
jgi:hypothetical protein